MAHEHDGTVELVDDRSEIRSVARDPAKGNRRSEDVVLVAVEMLENRAPARRISEGTVNENDCRLGHEASFELGDCRHSLRSASLDRPRGSPRSAAPVCALPTEAPIRP